MTGTNGLVSFQQGLQGHTSCSTMNPAVRYTIEEMNCGNAFVLSFIWNMCVFPDFTVFDSVQKS